MIGALEKMSYLEMLLAVRFVSVGCRGLVTLTFVDWKLTVVVDWKRDESMVEFSTEDREATPRDIFAVSTPWTDLDIIGVVNNWPESCGVPSK